MNDAINFMSEYGITTVILAVLINILTGLIKLPVKALASKLEDSTRITRFLVFMPVLLGFLSAMAYSAAVNKSLVFDEGFYRLWLSSSSLSLTFYAVFEKIFPSRKKVLSSDEIDENKRLIEEIRTATGISDATAETNAETPESGNNTAERPVTKQRFILGRNKNERTEIEK